MISFIKNEVVKPALAGIAGPWISGGIEFNWPQHHRPTTYMPLEAALEENADGSKTVWTGETDPIHRMNGMVGVTLDKGRSYIKAASISPYDFRIHTFHKIKETI